MTDRTDPGNGHHRRRRGPRLGDSRAPVTTIVVILAAAAAVIAGFVVLRSVTDPATGPADATGGAVTSVNPAPGTTASATVVATSTSTPPSTSTSTSTTTTLPRASRSDAIVVVANASGVDHSATAMTEELDADGYTTASVANATGPHLERSIIYYLEGDVGAQGVANLLAEQIPTARTLPMPDDPPLDRPLNGATVALLLGTDAAGRSLTDLATD